MKKEDEYVETMSRKKEEKNDSWNSLVEMYVTTATFKNSNFYFIATLMLLELCLCLVIVKYVPYTEIDWKAYMQEVTSFWDDGELDYLKIRGDTGPLVYPAGFLYLFQLLKYWTTEGTDIHRAQMIFVGFYLFHTAIVLYLYSFPIESLISSLHEPTSDKQLQTKKEEQLQKAHHIWSWRFAMTLCSLSKRMHSIYLLRLFNDGPAMILSYLSIAFFANASWKIGCVFFSLAVSIKMNVLLFAPGLLLLLLQSQSTLYGTIICLSICASIQLLLGAPFLLTYPISYIRKAFEFDRVFFYKWTVNWKCLTEDVFLSKSVSIGLLLLHIGILIFFAMKWLRHSQRQVNKKIFFSQKQLSPNYVIFTMFISNFIGIAFARTLHYQFYSWYYHTVPYMIWYSVNKMSLKILMGIFITGGLEYAFNVFPATPLSSSVLQISHILLLLSLLFSSVPSILPTSQGSNEGNTQKYATSSGSKKQD